MAARTKVIPPFAVKRVYLLCVLIGALGGLVTQVEERWAFRVVETDFVRRHLGAMQTNVVAGILTLVLLLLPCVLAAAWLSCLSQRRWQAAAAGAVAGAAEALVSFYGGQVLWAVHGGAEFSALDALEMLIPTAILAALGAGAALLVRWLVRAGLFTTVEQDGSRCPRCGYQLGSEIITVCPECGTPADPSRLSFARLHRVSAWLGRRAWVLAAVLGAVMLVQLAVVVRYRTIPALRFARSFPCAQPVMGVMIPNPTPMGSFDSSCMASYLPVSDDPSRVVVLLYVPDSRSGLTAMRLAIGATPGKPSFGSQASVDYGVPEVACDLSRELAERVTREGVPPELVRAVEAEADRAKWSPGSTTAGVFYPGPTVVWVDGGKYFAPK